MFIQAMAGAAEVGPDDLAVENGPDLVGENNPELENMEVGGGDNVNECKILHFFSFNFITIMVFRTRTIFN